MFHRYIVLKYLTHDMWTEKNKKKRNNTLFFLYSTYLKKAWCSCTNRQNLLAMTPSCSEKYASLPLLAAFQVCGIIVKKNLGPGGTWQTLVTCDASDDNKISEYISSYLVRLPVRIPFLFWPHRRWCNRCTGIYWRCQPSALGNAEMHFFHQFC